MVPLKLGVKLRLSEEFHYIDYLNIAINRLVILYENLQCNKHYNHICIQNSNKNSFLYKKIK